MKDWTYFERSDGFGKFKDGQLLIGLSEHAWGLPLPTCDNLKS